MTPECIHERGIVPLVNQNELRAGERRVEIDTRAGVARDPQRWVTLPELGDRQLADFRRQVQSAPGVDGLVDLDLVPPRRELRGDTTQEMRVTVVPVRKQRMTEEADIHVPASAPNDGRAPPGKS